MFSWAKINHTLDEFWPRVQLLELADARAEGWREDRADEYCPRCAATTGPGGFTTMGCPACLDQKIPWDRAARVGVYRKPLANWVMQFKYERRWAWRHSLGPMLVSAIRRSDDRVQSSAPLPTFVTFVPLHPIRQWWRGFNQAMLLADELSHATNWPVLPILKRVRHARAQVFLSQSKRAANLSRAFQIKSIDLRGCRIWLVDDVKTTGTTLRTCTHLLRKAGAEEINIAVIASADLANEPSRGQAKINPFTSSQLPRPASPHDSPAIVHTSPTPAPRDSDV